MPQFPDKGTLFFDPVFAANRDFRGGSYKVIYEAGDVSDCPPRAMPSGLPDAFSHEWIVVGYCDSPTTGYKRWNVNFVDATTYNSHLDFGADFQAAILEANLQAEQELEKRAKKQHYEHLPRHFIACGPSSFAWLEGKAIKYNYAYGILQFRLGFFTYQPSCDLT